MYYNIEQNTKLNKKILKTKEYLIGNLSFLMTSSKGLRNKNQKNTWIFTTNDTWIFTTNEHVGIV